MASSTAQVVIVNNVLSGLVLMEIDRDLLARALSGARNCQAMVIILYKSQYAYLNGQNPQWINWSALLINETDESKARPHGCGCECGGCDQGYHCHKEARSCHV
ncbi:MAG TPA: hypothetical protein VNI82_00575 [Candidatus Nitrosotenuis sp.]|nr:hypothetical protein [Candidatus Nitrosotenuis sp.]